MAPRRLARWFQAGLGVFVLTLYAYIVITQPYAADIIPPISPVGSPLPRLGALWFHPALPASAPMDDGDGEGICGVIPTTFTGPPLERLYGQVAESELPWANELPIPLLTIRQQHGAYRFIAAFRTTLPSPIWEEAHNVAVAARYLQGVVLHPGETGSLLRMIGPFTVERGYRDGPTYVGGRIVPTLAGGVCKIATALYNAVVLSDLHVVERKPHSMRVPYVPAGRDAAVATGSKDLRFQNNQDSPIVLWADMEGTTLYVAVYGQYEPPLVTWKHETLDVRKTWVIRRAASDLEPGEERVLIEGIDGVTVRTTVRVYDPSSPSVRRLDYTDTYAPLPETVEFGP